MQQDNVTSNPPSFAEIVRRHDNLDAARGYGADGLLNRFGRGGIEACRRFVKQKYGGITCECPCEGKPLLFSAGESPCR